MFKYKAAKQDEATRSCLVNPFKKPSSQEALHRYKDAVKERSQPTTQWEGDVFFKEQHQQQDPLTPRSWDSTTSTQLPSSRESSNVSSLLTPPTPSDRSHKLHYEREKRRKGLYEGELEPEGVRGQEASYPPPSQTMQPSSSAARGTTTLLSPMTPRMRSFETTGLSAASSSRVSTLTSAQLTPIEPYASLARAKSADNSSNSSSEDSSLEQMKPDLLAEGGGGPLQFSTTTGNAVRMKETRQDFVKRRHDEQHPELVSQTSSRTNRQQQEAFAAHHQDEVYRKQHQQQQPGRMTRIVSPSPQLQRQGPVEDVDSRRVYQQQQQQKQRMMIQQSDTMSTQSEDVFQHMLPDLMPTNSSNDVVEAAPTSIKKHQQQPQQQQPQKYSPYNTAGSAEDPTLSPVAAAAASHAAAVSYSPDRKHLPPTDNVHALHTIAMEHLHNGEYDMALQAFARVLYLQRKQHGEIHPSVASAFHNLGTVHAKRAALLFPDSAQQRHCRAQALACFQAAARTARDSLGKTHPNVAVSLVRIGFLLLQSRQYQNAIVTFKESLRIRLAHYGAQHGLVANLYNNLGVCNMHLGHFAQGRDYLEAALDIQRDIVERVSGKDRWVNQLELADTLFNIGGLCLEWIRRQGPDARRAIDAEEAFAEALEIRTRVLGPSDQMVLQVKALLDMARALPRPKAPPSTPTKRVTPIKVESESYHPVSTSRTTAISPPRTPKVEPRPTSMPQLSNNKVVARNVITPDMRPASVLPTSRNESLLSTSSKPFDEAMDSAESPTRRSIFRSPSPQPDDEKAYRTSSPPRQMPPLKPSHRDTGRRNGQLSPPRQTQRTPREDKSRTRIYESPHHVPPVSSAKKDVSQEVLADQSLESSFAPDVSMDTSAALAQRSHSYDAEENCILSETGVESEHGRIHYPLSWNKAGLQLNRDSESPTRNIMVARPFRKQSSGSDVGVSRSVSSEKWGSETVNFSTGNKDRDILMNRARAILDAHDDDGPSRPAKSPEHPMAEFDAGPNADNALRENNIVPDLLEDGVAPLGGSWPRKPRRVPLSSREMLNDPMNNMNEIHEEATRLLNTSNLEEAQVLFETILLCQRRRHGHLHPDVASALHNVGIVLLRSKNYDDALKAFEEAARIRKGSLGREHPQVAESLVKVGITLLLLHRFEDALWSFREALSVRKHAMGALHPSTARIYNNIGCVHVEFDEFREARRAFEAALDIQRNALTHDPGSGPLMFGTATTLCNLGYLYRHRDMHVKAALVLKEAVALQESVLGFYHPTVLSTLDNLADSCANSGNAADALRHYRTILDRFQARGNNRSKKALRAEAVLLYKTSRVHRQRNDRQAQLEMLKLALRSIRAYNDDSSSSGHTDTLERRIQYDIRACREELEKDELKWI